MHISSVQDASQGQSLRALTIDCELAASRQILHPLFSRRLPRQTLHLDQLEFTQRRNDILPVSQLDIVLDILYDMN